ncbi:hypothetical protein ACMT1E_13990 [Sphingomonas flavalba]|uniref:hypothetical protein n=1 Tax=Sphingomonas flavalba TaxID=2559804 RepID=UPI0039E17FC1
MKTVMWALVAGALLVPGTAFAAKDKPGDAGKKDPNRVICRTETDIGSRLSRSRQCYTAAEWQQIRREQRMMIDRAQQSKTGTSY